MRFSPKQIINAAKVILNPRQAVDTMLNAMPPDKANMLRIMMNNNEDPIKVLNESARKGEITLQNLDEMRELYKMARKLGIRKITITDEQFAQLEQVIKSSGSNSYGGFKRF